MFGGGKNIVANIGMNTAGWDRGRQHLARTANTTKRQMQGVGQVKMTQAAHSWEDLGRSVSNAGRNIATVTGLFTAALGAGIRSAVGVYTAFEDAFADFQKVTEGTTEYFEDMDRAFMDMAKRIPASYEEIAGAAAAASRLGVASDYIEEFAETALMMGTATNMGTEDAAEALARFSNIMGTSFEDSHKLGSSIVDLGNNFATTEADIVAMSLRLAGAGKNANMSEGDVLALSAAMQSVGIRAEMGGTAMSKTINQINADLSRGGEEAERWASRAGMSTEQFAQAFEDDALGAIQLLLAGLKDGTAEGENMTQMLEELGITEMRQADVLTRMVEATDLLTEAQERGNKAFDEGSALSEEAALRWETFSAQMQILRNRIRNVVKVLAGPMVEALMDVMELISPLIDRFEDWTQNLIENEPEMAKTIAQFILIGGAIAFVITILATMATALGFMMTGLGSIATAMSKAGGIAFFFAKVFGFLGKMAFFAFGKLGLIISIGVLIYKLFNHLMETNEQFATSVKKMSEIASEKIEDIANVLEYMLTPAFELAQKIFAEVTEFFISEFNRVAEFFENEGQIIITAFTEIGKLFSDIYHGIIKPVFDFLIYDLQIFRKIWDFIWWVVENTILMAWDAIKNIVQGGIDVILGIVQLFSAMLYGDWSDMWDAIKRLFTGAFQLLIGIVQAILLLPLFRVFGMGFKAIRVIFTGGLKGIRDLVFLGFKAVFTTIYNFMKMIVTNIWTALKSIVVYFRTRLYNIRNTASTGMTKVWEIFVNILGFIKQVFFTVFTAVFNVVGTFLGKIILAVFAGMTRLGQNMHDTFMDILSWLGQLPRRMYEAGANLINGMIEGVKAKAGELWDNVTGVVSNAVDGVLGFLGIKSPSRLFMDIGEDTMEGMEIGVDEGGEGVKSTMDDFAWDMESKGSGVADDAWDYGSDTAAAFGDMATDMGGSMTDFGSSLDGASDKIDYSASNMPDQAKRMAGGVKDEFDFMSSGIADSTDKGFGDANKNSARQTQALNKAVGLSFKTLEGDIRKSMRAVVVIVENEFERVAKATQTNMRQASRSAQAEAMRFESIGRMMMQGLARGINRNSGMVVTASARAANRAALTAKRELKVQSPSKVFEDIGRFVSQGLAVGIDKDSGMASKSAANLAGALSGAFNPNMAVSGLGVSKQANAMHKQAQTQLSASMESELSVSKQPAVLNLSLGRKNYTAFVEDISDEQERKSKLEAAFR